MEAGFKAWLAKIDLFETEEHRRDELQEDRGRYFIAGDVDCDNADITIAKVIANCMTYLIRNDTCTPSDQSAEEWKKTLEEIREGFARYLYDFDDDPLSEKTEGLDRAFDLLRSRFTYLWL